MNTNFLGIGRDVCIALTNGGATVYAFSRTQQHLIELKKEFPSIHTTSVDLGNWRETVKAFEFLKGKEIHGLVNNAGIAVNKPFLEITENDLDKFVLQSQFFYSEKEYIHLFLLFL